MNGFLEKILPKEITPDFILNLIDNDEWRRSKFMALAGALRRCDRLDWAAYLDNNPDVRRSGFDPIIHFLKYGIGENRKLYIRNEKAHSNETFSPLVSVIISNYNNEIYLDKCINSVITQTLKNIEIIIVDDGSTDHSRQIINKYARTDSRIKTIFFESNQSLFMTRRAGVALASGEFVMFLDSDDSYVSRACEVASHAMRSGHKVCAFNLNIINHNVFKHSPAWYNALPAGEYKGCQKIDLAYNQEKMPHFMCGKIFGRKLIQECFRQLETGRINMYEDIYSFLLPAMAADSIIKIADKLVNYSFGTGMSTGGHIEINKKTLLRHSDVLGAFERLCRRTGHMNAFLNMRKSFLRWSFEAIPQVEAKNARFYFDGLAARFGILPVVMDMVRVYWPRPDELARAFGPYKTAYSEIRAVRAKIGLLTWKGGGPLEACYTRNIISALKKLGYEVALFYEDVPVVNLDGLEAYRLHQHGGENDVPHLDSLWHGVRQARIDKMLFVGINEMQFLWDAILLKLMGIETKGLFIADFRTQIKCKFPSFGHDKWLRMLQCLDGVVCPRDDALLYYQANGVADLDILCPYLGPIRKSGENAQIGKPIVFLAFHTDPESMEALDNILHAFANLLSKANGSHLIISSHDFLKQRKRMAAKARRLGIENDLVFSSIEDAVNVYLGSVDVVIDTGSFFAPFAVEDFGVPVIKYPKKPLKQAAYDKFFLDVLFSATSGTITENKNNGVSLSISTDPVGEFISALARIMGNACSKPFGKFACGNAYQDVIRSVASCL